MTRPLKALPAPSDEPKLNSIKCPPQPKPTVNGTCLNIPEWLMPITMRVSVDDRGVGDAAKNAIGFTSEGDLIFYRAISRQDWLDLPSMIGIEEVWITIRLRWEE